jgi:hypothetical protein
MNFQIVFSWVVTLYNLVGISNVHGASIFMSQEHGIHQKSHHFPLSSIFYLHSQPAAFFIFNVQGPLLDLMSCIGLSASRYILRAKENRMH